MYKTKNKAPENDRASNLVELAYSSWRARIVTCEHRIKKSACGVWRVVLVRACGVQFVYSTVCMVRAGGVSLVEGREAQFSCPGKLSSLSYDFFTFCVDVATKRKICRVWTLIMSLTRVYEGRVRSFSYNQID